MRTQDQENKQQLLQKYKNLSFLDGEENQTDRIDPENLDFKRPNRRNKRYCVVGQPLDWNGDNVDLIISRQINDNFVVIIKGVDKYPDMGYLSGYLSTPLMITTKLSLYEE